MRINRDWRIDFENEDYAPVKIYEYDDSDIAIEQGGDVILIPKSSAGAFVDAVAHWVSTGGVVVKEPA